MVSSLSYTVETAQKAPGGAFLGRATAPCDGKDCRARLHVWLGKSNNPDDVMLKARRQGWQFDAWKRGRNFCPACIEARKLKAKGDSGKKAPPPSLDSDTVKRLSRSAQTLSSMLDHGMPPPEYQPRCMPIEPKLITITIDPPYHQETELNATTKLAHGTDQGAPRPLTVDERLAVRNLLDHKFDDKAGRYTDGYSDQRVGQELNVPWAAVKALREVAYGELKSNDELDAVKQVLAAVEGKLIAAKRVLEAARAGAEAARDVVDKADKRVAEAVETVESVESTMDMARRNIANVAAKLGIVP